MQDDSRAASLRGRQGFAHARLAFAWALALSLAACAHGAASARTGVAHAARITRVAPVSAPAEVPAPAPSRQLVPLARGGAAFVRAPREAARANAAAPDVVLLHGMCSRVTPTCDALGALASSWVACPRGNGRCGELADWSGSGEAKAAHVDEALEALAGIKTARGAGETEGRGRAVLVGFSRGAYVARDVIYARPGAFRAAVFLGAGFVPDAARLRASGVERVVFGAGDLDGAAPTMRRAAIATREAGLPARFVSLGALPHALPEDLQSALGESLAWALE